MSSAAYGRLSSMHSVRSYDCRRDVHESWLRVEGSSEHDQENRHRYLHRDILSVTTTVPEGNVKINR